MIKIKRVEEICSKFKDKKVLVFGDVILDRYIFGKVNRISPEAPVPVVKVEKEEFRLGGAGNVAANIDKLGATSYLLGICGDDGFATELFRLKSENNVIITSDINQTMVKTRIISQRQQIVRVDREEIIQYTSELNNRITKVLTDTKLKGIHGIIISDYAKGTLTSDTMKILKKIAHDLKIPIIVDPKPPNFHLYSDIDGITPNKTEAEEIYKKRINSDTEAATAIKYIRKKFGTHFSIITRGDKGISASEKGRKIFHLPAFNHEVYDVTGAGDTVVSVLLLSLVSGATLREAVALANGAASIVVEKIGVSQVLPRELQERMRYLLKKPFQ